MGTHWLYKGRALRVGLGLVGVWVLLTWVVVTDIPGSVGELLLLIFAAIGLSGFVLMIVSTFLPEGKREKPTFTQELMGREKLNFGGVYTEGNRETVLDDEDEEDGDEGWGEDEEIKG